MDFNKAWIKINSQHSTYKYGSSLLTYTAVGSAKYGQLIAK